MRTSLLLPVVLGATALCCNAQGVVNGNFQTGNLMGWSVSTTANGLGTGASGTCLGGEPCPTVTAFDVTGSGSSDAAEFDAGMTGGLPGTGDFEGDIISQEITLSPGTMDLSLDWAVDDTYDEANEDGGEFAFLLNGVLLNSYDTGLVLSGATDMGTLSASTTIATAGTYDLSVEVAREYDPQPGVDQYVTDIDATGGAVTDVPEGGSPWAYLLIALAGCCGALFLKWRTGLGMGAAA